MLSVGNMWAVLSRHSHLESRLAGFSDVGYVSAEVPALGLYALRSSSCLSPALLCIMGIWSLQVVFPSVLVS